MKASIKLFYLSILLASLSACTTVSIDEMRWQETDIDLSQDSIVILGRHHSPEY